MTELIIVSIQIFQGITEQGPVAISPTVFNGLLVD